MARDDKELQEEGKVPVRRLEASWSHLRFKRAEREEGRDPVIFVF